MRALLLLITAASLAGCPKPTPIPNGPVPDADAAVPSGYSCDTACANGRKNHCTWAKPTAAGAACEDVCANANRPDGPLRWGLACRSTSLADGCDSCP